MSTIRDPETYDRFEKIVLVHGVRTVAELAYEDLISTQLPTDELVGEMVAPALIYYPTVTREAYRTQGRIPDLIESGKLFADIGLPALDKKTDRVMLCGNPQLLVDVPAQLKALDYIEGNTGEPGDYVIEKAFVEK